MEATDENITIETFGKSSRDLLKLLLCKLSRNIFRDYEIINDIKKASHNLLPLYRR